jgi:hypothetical protein
LSAVDKHHGSAGDRGGEAELIRWLSAGGKADGFLLTTCELGPRPGGDPWPLDGIQCHRVTFLQGSLADATLTDAQLDHCIFQDGALAGDAALRSAKLHGCHFIGKQTANFSACEIDGGKFTKIDLSMSELNNARLCGVAFEGDLTMPNRMDLFGLEVDLAAWQRLKPRLTSDQRSVVLIVDDGDRIRNAYSGPWFKLHLIALAIFLAPHVLFLIEAELRSVPGCTRDCQTILGAYARNLIGRGPCWIIATKLITGALLLLYNSLRFALMVKALALKDVVRFSFANEPRWEWMFNNYRRLLLFNIFLVVLHLLTFLLEPVTFLAS